MTLNTGYYSQVYTLVTLILCGLMQYFTGIQLALWIPFFLALLMVKLLVMQAHDGSLHLNAQETTVLILYFSFLVLVGALTLIRDGITAAIVASKSEIALSLMIICLLLGFCWESQIYRATRHLYWMFYAQIPVMIYQVLLAVPQRVTVRGEGGRWNSMIGTFDDGPMRGESTTTIGLFCLLIVLSGISEYKHGLIMFKPMALYIVPSIGLCIISEVEFVILLSPIFLARAWLSPGYVKDVSEVNLKALLAVAAGMLLLISLSIVILAYYCSTAFGGGPSRSSLNIFIDSLSYIFDPNYIMPTDESERPITFLLWLKSSDLWRLPGTLLNYRLNTTSSGSTVSPGFLNITYNLILDSTSLSMLLQEVGVIGTLLFISLFVYILRVCRLEPLPMLEQLDQQGLQLLGLAPTFDALVVSCLISLPYSQILMVTPMLQFLFCPSLGSSLVVRRVALRCIG